MTCSGFVGYDTGWKGGQDGRTGVGCEEDGGVGLDFIGWDGETVFEDEGEDGDY